METCYCCCCYFLIINDKKQKQRLQLNNWFKIGTVFQQSRNKLYCSSNSSSCVEIGKVLLLLLLIKKGTSFSSCSPLLIVCNCQLLLLQLKKFSVLSLEMYSWFFFYFSPFFPNSLPQKTFLEIQFSRHTSKYNVCPNKCRLYSPCKFQKKEDGNYDERSFYLYTFFDVRITVSALWLLS